MFPITVKLILRTWHLTFYVNEFFFLCYSILSAILISPGEIYRFLQLRKNVVTASASLRAESNHYPKIIHRFLTSLEIVSTVVSFFLHCSEHSHIRLCSFLHVWWDFRAKAHILPLHHSLHLLCLSFSSKTSFFHNLIWSSYPLGRRFTADFFPFPPRRRSR